MQSYGINNEDVLLEIKLFRKRLLQTKFYKCTFFDKYITIKELEFLTKILIHPVTKSYSS